MESDSEQREVLRKALKAVLKEERIKAVMAEVPFDEAYEMVRPSVGDVGEAPVGRPLDISKIPGEFMTYCNCMVRDCSSETAVTFMHLPAPPPHHRRDDQVKYHQLLSELTKGLPPTVMVHGIHAVTSTAL